MRKSFSSNVLQTLVLLVALVIFTGAFPVAALAQPEEPVVSGGEATPGEAAGEADEGETGATTPPTGGETEPPATPGGEEGEPSGDTQPEEGAQPGEGEGGGEPATEEGAPGTGPEADGGSLLQEAPRSSSTLSTDQFHQAVSVVGATSMLMCGSDPASAEEVKSGDVLSTGSNLWLKYNFNIGDAQRAIIENAITNSFNKFFLQVPNNAIKWTASPGTSVPIKIYNTETVFATLHFETNGGSGGVDAYVAFDATYWQNPANGNIQNGYVTLQCQMDAAAVGSAETLPIVVAGAGKSFNIKVEENQPAENTVAKTGGYNATTGQFEWEVVFTVGATPAQYLKDSFATNTMVYADNSLEVTVDYKNGHETNITTPTAPPAGAVSCNATGATTVLTFDMASYNLAEGDVVTITYRTALSDAKVDAGADVTVKNSAQLYANDGTTKTGKASTAEGTVKGSQLSWMRKIGIPMDDTNAKNTFNPTKILWRVEVSRLDRRLTDLVLYDKLSADSSTYLGPIDVDKVAVYSSDDAPNATTGEVGGAVKLTSGYSASAAGGTTGNGETWDLMVTFTNPNDHPGYVVTYETPVLPTYKQNPPKPSDEPKNKAWLEFDWKDYHGVGPGFYHENFEPPAVSKGTGFDANMLHKEGTYDASTGIITWKITVNPHKVYVHGGTITDELDDASYGDKTMKYVAGSFRSDAAMITLTQSSDHELEFTIAEDSVTPSNNLGANTATIEFKTKVEDAKYFAHQNQTSTFKNTAEFDGYVHTELDGTSGIKSHITNTCNGTAEVKSNMLEKEGAGYDYNGHIATWELAVNKNKMAMTSPVITDKFPGYMTLETDSVQYKKAGDGSFTTLTTSDVGGAYYEISSLNAGEYTLTIHLQTIAAGVDSYVVEYKTAVSANEIAHCKTQATLDLANSASLAFTEAGAYTPSVNTTYQIPNDMLQKSMVSKVSKVGVGYIMDYSVNINPHKVDVAGHTITDTIPAGTALLFDTVKLQEATLSTNADDEPAFAASGASYSVSQLKFCGASDGTNYAFTITLPGTLNGAPNHNAYILTYSLQVTAQKASYANNIAFDAQHVNPAAGKSAASVAGGGGAGGGEAITRTALHLTVTCRDTGKPLEGVSYDLYTTINGVRVCIGTGKTDANGKLSFYGLTHGDAYKYSLTQHNATLPEGYGNPQVAFEGGRPTPIGRALFQLKAGDNHAAATNHPRKNSASTDTGGLVAEPQSDNSSGGGSSQSTRATVAAAPQTGDSTGVPLYLGLSGLSLAGLAALLFLRAKSRRPKAGQGGAHHK